MENVLLFYKKAEAVQSILQLPELKVTKPSDTRWFSHERCVQAILKESPPIMTTLYNFYDQDGDAEVYGIALVSMS